MRLRRQLTGAVAVVIALGTASLVAPGAGAQDDDAPFLLNDSPMYTFEGGVPTRNAPVAVVSVNASKLAKGVQLALHDLAYFAPTGVAITGRAVFYGRRGSPAIAGGFEFRWGPGSGPVETTLVERTGDGTGVSPEVWEPSAEKFGTVRGTYTDDGISFRFTSKGSYLKLLLDQYTAVGLDLYTGESGSSVQPSARVSIGDLTGTRPGLLARLGTGVGEDGDPIPWTTLRYAGEFAGFRIAAAIDSPTSANVDIGKLVERAPLQVRLFTADPFTPVAPGARFVGYELVLFALTDMFVAARLGDAFSATDDGRVTIGTDKPGRFQLTYGDPIQGSYAAVQTVVPAEGGNVLLATSFHPKF